MQVYALWHGGAGYSPSDMDDLESFASIEAAKDALHSRMRNGYWQRQDFPFVNREPASVFTPCVEGDPAEDGGSSMWIYFYNPTEVGDPYPDRIIEFGPRGGVKVVAA